MKKNEKIITDLKNGILSLNGMKYIFEEANRIFLKRDIQLIFDNVSERSLCGRLTTSLNNEINKLIKDEYYADNEYNRNRGRLKTISDEKLTAIPIVCDIIVHSRGNNIKQDNLIAIEIKKEYRKQKEKEKDKNRLKALTKDTFDNVWSFDGITLPEHVCRYILGIYYEIRDVSEDINVKKVYIEYYFKGEKISDYEININS